MKRVKIPIAIFIILITVLLIAIFSNIEFFNNALYKGIIKNSSQNINANPSNDSEIGDLGKITSATIIKRVTGTGPFDENDNPGNDSSEENNIVRSFDQITWTIDLTMGLKDGNSGISLSGGKINVKAEIPENCANLVNWDLDSMGWLEGSGAVSEDGRILTGQYSMSTKDTTIPGKQTLILVLKVNGAQNKTEIVPTFNFSIEGNNEDEKYIVQDEKTIVSAAPKYNVELKRNTDLIKEIEWTENGTTQKGRLYGYSLNYQLYNDGQTEKALKGIEYPKGDINLDIALKLEKVSVSDSSDVEDITDKSMPILYNYKMNKYDESSGYIPNRPMAVTRHAAHDWRAPGAFGGGEKYCYNSGSMSMSQQGNIIKTTISGYEFNGEFPTKYVGQDSTDQSIHYGKNIGCFSVGYFQIFVPYTEESSEENYNYYLTIEDKNMEAYSNGGTKLAGQTKTNDDSSRVQHVIFSPGSYTEYHWLENSWGNFGGGLYSNYNQGDAKAAIGQKFVNRLDICAGQNNDLKDDIYDCNELMKFDGKAFKITQIDGKTWQKYPGKATNAYFNSDMEFKMLYAAKPDGTNWTSDQEMKDADEEDLLFFTSEEELKKSLGQNAYCIGVLFESISGKISYGAGCALEVALEVTEEAEVENVYQFLSVSRIYKKDNKLDRTTQTRENPDAVFPNPDYELKRDYIKTAYDENGNIIPGTHNGNYTYGQSLLIISGKITVNHEVEDKTSDGAQKVNYDIGRNENIVTFSIKPQLEIALNSGSKVTGITVNVTETLPKGLTYEQGSSNYTEPEVINNEDGTQTLKWTIYNCTTGEEIQKIIFKAKIDEESENGTQYTSSVTVSADKIGASLPSSRTDTSTIQITNLAAHRLYKEVLTPVIEKNGEIKYRISYENKTEDKVEEFQLLDILPYIGDNRGTKYAGTYTLEKIDIKQMTNDQEVTNDNLKLYTTESETVKNMDAKNTGIGIDSIWKEESTENINKSAKGFAIKGIIQGRTKLEIEITINTKGNMAKDIYGNDAMAQIYSNSEQVRTGTVDARVVNRYIEGKIWEDSNGNGLMDETERKLEGIKVKLVKSETGEEIRTETTKEDGSYKFEDLEKAKYKIKIEYDNYYGLTEKEVDTNVEINSKFNQGTAETDEITKLDSIQSPEIAESNVNAGLVIKTNVIVKYLEKDNTPNDNTDNNKLINPDIVINGHVGLEYEAEQKDISGYTFIEDTKNTKGIMTKDTIEVIYYYSKNTRVTVKYLEKDDTPNDNTDNKKLIDPDIIINGYEGLDYNTEKKEISGYTFVEDTKNTSGKMTKEPIEVIYYYAQNTKAKVQHIDRETGEILKEETKNGKVGDIFETHAEDFEGYVLVQAPEEPNIIMDKTGEQIVKYYYAHISAGVIEKHIDIITGELIDSAEHKGNEGDSYKIPSKTFEGYDLVTEDEDGNSKLPTNAEGKMKIDLIEVKYYYIKRASVRVQYIDKLTGEKLETEDIIINGHEKDSYKTDQKEFEGYDLIEIPTNATGTMEVTKNQDGTFNTETLVQYYYIKRAGGVKEKHIDINSKNILAEEEHKGHVGDEYDIKSREFEGYDLVEKDSEGNNTLPTNSKGKMTEQPIEVDYYYAKKAKIIVQHIDKLTNEKIVEDEEIEGHEGEEYKTEQKYFEEYDLVEIPENAEGIIEITKNEDGTDNTEIIVKYYYKKKAEVEVQYLEKETEKQLEKTETIKGYVKDQYKTKEKEIPYYKLVDKTDNTQGEMTEDKIIVKYYYEKQIFNLSVDKWVESTNINGTNKKARTIETKDKLYSINIHRKNIETTDIKITYKIRITNKGEIPGTVNKLTEIIPTGYTFNQADNNINWIEQDGILMTEDLKEVVIQPGQYKEVDIVLRWDKGEENFGQKNNTVMLTEISNPAGYDDIDKEDNMAKAEMILVITTGLDRNGRILLIAGVQILILMAVGIMLGRKIRD